MITLKADELSNVLVRGNAALPALAGLTPERAAANPGEQGFCTIGIRKLYQSKGFSSCKDNRHRPEVPSTAVSVIQYICLPVITTPGSELFVLPTNSPTTEKI